MSQPETLEIRPSRWMWWLGAATVAVFVPLGVIAFVLPTPPWQRLASAAMAAIAVLGVVELTVRRVRLSPSGVWVIYNFRRRFVARAELDSVTWARGAGISLRRVDGTWMHLPELGHNSLSLTNSIRAWLKRTAAAG